MDDTYAGLVPRDPAATRTRILGAAVEEFAAHGLAGARVDRIAAAAAANKQSIYAHFGDKEALFDAALHHVITDLTEAVPLTEDDLPGYAGRLVDYQRAHPQAHRMSAWRGLERPGAGPDASGLYAAKVAAMTGGRTGPDSGLPPVDVLVLVIALAFAWPNTTADLLMADGSDPADPARLAAHREAVVEAVRRICAAP